MGRLQMAKATAVCERDMAGLAPGPRFWKYVAARIERPGNNYFFECFSM